MRAQQARLDTVSDNISNLNTDGYKSGSVTFKDTLYTALSDGTVRGTGAIVASTARSFTQGTPMNTGIPLGLHGRWHRVLHGAA